MTADPNLEYTALRQTILARGGARPWAFLAGLIGWTATLSAVLAWLPNPLASAVPLVLLVATFEVVRSLHLGVERVGRYIQAFFEESADGSAPTTPPAWEHTAMVFGPAMPGAGVHPYYLPVFIVATSVNFVAVLLPDPFPVEMVALAVPHLAFIAWMVAADRRMRRQRTTELARFRELRRQMQRRDGPSAGFAPGPSGTASPRA